MIDMLRLAPRHRAKRDAVPATCPDHLAARRRAWKPTFPPVGAARLPKSAFAVLGASRALTPGADFDTMPVFAATLAAPRGLRPASHPTSGGGSSPCRPAQPGGGAPRGP